MTNPKFLVWFNAYFNNYSGTRLMDPDVVAEQAWQQAETEMKQELDELRSAVKSIDNILSGLSDQVWI